MSHSLKYHHKGGQMIKLCLPLACK